MAPVLDPASSSHSPKMLFYVVALVPLALACGPGTGPITATPTMKFAFSPPLAWTFDPVPANTNGGQSLSQMAAQNRINADIEFAVLKAVESYGYSTSGVNVKNAVTAQSAPVLADNTADCTAPPAIAFVGEAGVVTKECILAGAKIDAKNTKINMINSTITVTSPIALAQSNWENVATKVWASLTANAGVKFYGLIEIV